MKKLLTLSVVAMLLLIAGSALATNTRVLTMGEANGIVLDEANIWLYPSRINMYPNVAIGEVGMFDYYNDDYSSDMGQFGIHWKFGEKNPWVLGTYFFDASQRGTSYYGSYYYGAGGNYLGLGRTELPFRIPVSLDPIDFGWFDLPSTPTYNEENQRFSIFYGRKLGGKPFGFYFNKVQTSWKDDYPSFKGQEGLSEYDFGFGLTDAAGKWDVAVGYDMLSWSNKTTYVAPGDSNGVARDVTKPKGNYNLHVMGRMFHQVNPQWTLVPNAGILIGKYQAEFWSTGATPAVTSTEKFGVTSFWAGMGANYTPAANIMAVGEIGIGYTSLKEEYIPANPTAGNPSYTDKYKYFTLPYFRIGLEGKVFDWMDLRAGATSYWQRETDEYSAAPNPYYGYPGKTKYNYPSNMTYLGTGMHFGNFHIDTYTNPEILLNGFDFVSGNSTSNLNATVSILYEFK